MKGKHRVIVQNKRIRYDFTLQRNLTILRGDSATGKTALIDMIREYTNNGAESSIELSCDKPCQVVEGATWAGQLSVIRDSIVFIDEGNAFVRSEAFAAAIAQTDNYYVIASREALPNLPYSVEEIYGIRNAGKYGGLKQVYNSLYRLYDQVNARDTIKPDTVVTEDSNAGFQFFSGISREGVNCLAASGKSNILQTVKAAQGNVILIVADGAAFGSEIADVMTYMAEHAEIRLFLPESFEWMILSSGLIQAAHLNDILSEPSDYIESSIYFSWERFFTQLLVEITSDSYLKYSKRTLNAAYLAPDSVKRILAAYENLRLTD